jgi:hypothetical protein
MQICYYHKEAINKSLGDLADDREAVFQAQSLILQNALAANPDGVNAPPGICPLCNMSVRQAIYWLDEMGKSIRHERLP